MKQKQFTSEQIVAILQEAERGEKTIKEISRIHNITETTFYRWRRLYGGMSVPETLEMADRAVNVHAGRFCLVASGRGPSARRVHPLMAVHSLRRAAKSRFMASSKEALLVVRMR